jgi:hypothetical protein
MGVPVMSKELTFKELSQIPADIQKMWGKPPVLPNEDLEAYNDHALAIANSVKPPDFIGWLYVKDILDSTWEMLRLRRYKVQLVEMNDDRGIEREEEESFYELDELTTEAFLDSLDDYERIDFLLASAEVRRNASLREIERHRESLASRLRRASDDIIEGEFTEPSGQVANDVGISANDASTAPGPMEQAGVMTATPDLDKPPSSGSGEVAKASMIPANHDPGKSVSADSGPVRKGILVKKPTKPLVVVSLKPFVTVSKGIGDPSSHGPKKGAA